jgi:hypothetical protein
VALVTALAFVASPGIVFVAVSARSYALCLFLNLEALALVVERLTTAHGIQARRYLMVGAAVCLIMAGFCHLMEVVICSALLCFPLIVPSERTSLERLPLLTGLLVALCAGVPAASFVDAWQAEVTGRGKRSALETIWRDGRRRSDDVVLAGNAGGGSVVLSGWSVVPPGASDGAWASRPPRRFSPGYR